MLLDNEKPYLFAKGSLDPFLVFIINILGQRATPPVKANNFLSPYDWRLAPSKHAGQYWGRYKRLEMLTGQSAAMLGLEPQVTSEPLAGMAEDQIFLTGGFTPAI